MGFCNSWDVFLYGLCEVEVLVSGDELKVWECRFGCRIFCIENVDIFNVLGLLRWVEKIVMLCKNKNWMLCFIFELYKSRVYWE